MLYPLFYDSMRMQRVIMQDIITPKAPLVLLGCGHMGRALAEGWLKAGLDPLSLYIVNPSKPVGSFETVPKKHFVETLEALPTGLKAKAVILAVKPQVMNSVLSGVAGIITADSLVISIAAGVTLAQMKRGVAAEAVYIRSMPNTPAAIGAGVTGVTAEVGISAANKNLACDLLAATGQALWIERESQMDAVTAVSGSGPAYIFYMVECMAAAGVSAGLDVRVATALARQTVIGSGQLLAADMATPAEELRRRVTSPGGTTAAALDVLMEEQGLMKIMEKTVAAAKAKSQKLAN